MKRSKEKSAEPEQSMTPSRTSQRQRKSTAKLIETFTPSSDSASTSKKHQTAKHVSKRDKTDGGGVKNVDSKSFNHQNNFDMTVNQVASCCPDEKSSGVNKTDSVAQPSSSSRSLVVYTSSLSVTNHCQSGCKNSELENTEGLCCLSSVELKSQDASRTSEIEPGRLESFCQHNKGCKSAPVYFEMKSQEKTEQLLPNVATLDKNESLEAHEHITDKQVDASEMYITIETKDGLSSEKIPFFHFLKKVVVDRESGNLNIDLGQFISPLMSKSTGFNGDQRTDNINEEMRSISETLSQSASKTDCENKAEEYKAQKIPLDKQNENCITVSDKPMKRRGRPPKRKQTQPTPVDINIKTDSLTLKDSMMKIDADPSGSNSKIAAFEKPSSGKEKYGFSHSPRRSGRTPARSSRFGDDFVDSITLGKIAPSTSTWNTQLMTLALAAETHKNKPNKMSIIEAAEDEQHVEGSQEDDDGSDFSPDKAATENSREAVLREGVENLDEEQKNHSSTKHISVRNTVDDKRKKSGGSGIRGPKTLKKYEPVDPVVKRSLQDAFSHAQEATEELFSTEKLEKGDNSRGTTLYYTIMEPKMEARGNGLLVHKSEDGVSFRIVDFVGNSQSSNVNHFSKSYPQDRFFSCDLCENIFQSTNSWLHHNKYIHNRNIDSFETSLNKTCSQTEYKCEFCDQRFPYKFMLDIHIKRKRHSDVKTFRCTLCKESFATHKSREEHWMISHPARSCGLCGKQVANIVMLRRHINHNCHGARFRKHAGTPEVDAETGIAISKESEINVAKGSSEDEEYESESDDFDDSLKESDGEDGIDDIEEDSSNSNQVKTESGKVECDICGTEFSTYSGLWYHKLDEHHEYFPQGYMDKLKDKLEKNQTFFVNAHNSDLHKDAEVSKNRFYVFLKPKWPPNKFKLSICADEKDFTFKTSDGQVDSESLHQNVYADVPMKKETSFSCIQCGESFQFASNYREHRSRVHGECFEVVRLLGAFQCTLCSETYPCQFMLDKHLKKHVGKKLLPCTLCGLFFHKIQERRLHWKTAHPGIGCPNCGKMYASIKYLQKHISLNCQDHFPPTKKFLEFQKKQHSDFEMPKHERKVEKKIIQCHLCPKLCSSVHGWRRHMSDAHEDAGFSKLSNTCIICDELVYGYKALEKHLLENHAVESGLPVEEEEGMVEEALKKCDMDITAYRKAGRNNADIYQDEKGNYHCPSCPKTHSDLRALRTHIRIHVNMKLECSICNKTFKNPTLLKQHVQRHRKNAVYTCDSCSKKFLTLQKLNKHRKVHHSTGNFVCDLCGMSFALNDYLQKHKRCHTDKRPHCCTICGKTFRTKPELRVHVLIHTRETPYKCQFCGRGFSQKGNYRIHLAQHTGEKPYQCDQCEISFALLCHLKRHKVTHDQKINYRCSWCDKECTQRKHMQMHVQRVHREDFYQYEEQMKLESPVPIAPSQVKLYNRRLGKMNKIRRQYRTRAQKCDSTVQQLMNGIDAKAEPMDEDTETSQNIVIEPIVEPMMEAVSCDIPVNPHENGGFEILVSEDHQNYAKHAIPLDLIGQDPSNVEIVMGENNEINIIIKDPSALQEVMGDQESLVQLSGGSVEVQESLQQVVEALVTHAKGVSDEDSQLSLGMNELDKSALPGSSQIMSFESPSGH